MRLSVTLTYKHKDHGQDKWIELAIFFFFFFFLPSALFGEIANTGQRQKATQSQSTEFVS